MICGHGDMEQLWQGIKTSLGDQIPGHAFRMWIDPLQALKNDAPHNGSADDPVMRLQCPNLFFQKRVKEHFSHLILNELQRLAGRSMKLELVIGNGKPTKGRGMPAAEQLPLPNMTVQPHCGRMLRRDYTFDHFVVGRNNEFAYSAALSVAARKSHQQQSLFLLSKTGMGKSHLSQAIGHQIMNSFPTERVYYMTAEDFTSEMVSSYKTNSVSLFKEKYHKGCDVLLLEDIHYLSGKERTQIELAHTLDSLLNENKRIIFSSCCSPTEIPKLSENLRSRLTSGLISSIEPPDYRVRLRILKQYARANSWQIPAEVLEYLACELTNDVRQLKSGLVGVSTRASLLGSAIDLTLAAGVIENMVQKSRQVTIDAIKQLICKYYNITPKDLVSPSRKQGIVRPRQVAIYLARHYTDQPLQAIGKSFNRYHATALHAIGTVEKGIRQGSPIKGQVDYLQKKLESGEF